MRGTGFKLRKESGISALKEIDTSLPLLFGPLQDLLGKFQSERHYTDEKRDSALLAINKALIETKRYIEAARTPTASTVTRSTLARSSGPRRPPKRGTRARN